MNRKSLDIQFVAGWITVVCLFVFAMAGCVLQKPASVTVGEPERVRDLPAECRLPERSSMFSGQVPRIKAAPAKGIYVPVVGGDSAFRSIRMDIRSQGFESWTNLEGPVRRSLDYVSRMPQKSHALDRDGMRLTWGQIRRSLEELLGLLPRLDREPELLASRFSWYGVKPSPIMTGYYTPEIEASLTKRPGYDYPLYGVPADLKWGHVSGSRNLQFYRVVNGKVLPYYDRRALDVKKVLSGKGYELAWAKDPVDVFYLQVEGCGRLRLPDGTVKNVLYGAKNGHKFKGLGRIMYEKGLLPRSRLSKEYVREYLEKHPERMFELMAENRSYVFFRLADMPPEGAMGKPLTPMVSIATDRSVLPLGSVLAFEAVIPEKASKKSGRECRRVAGIGLAQDTGSAIQGARLDYYIGEGFDVEPVASRIKTPVTVYLLVSKEALNNG